MVHRKVFHSPPQVLLIHEKQPEEVILSKAVCLYIQGTAEFFPFLYNWDYWWLLSVIILCLLSCDMFFPCC